MIFVELKLETNVRRQTPQIAALLVPHDRMGIGNGNLSVGLFLFRFIGTSTIVDSLTYSVVIVARLSGDAAAADLVDHFIWPNVVAY